ncbi:Hachiman antiphage defense system protein HamA [Mesorhizobium sp. B4-1-1]|uniref:Hachiman antiphage defense system protein HamA n=1 Tax=Mesorhizobium sp. B4-1-1 TaxID=2589890 RepID=UPI0011266B3F|nr:Hachiman antiphage defense system protein HamA [Mesorhizobium sp. B4-1-1]TPI22524.1 DUF1837 domain-containing protein [Mesorhizobium sp. B4-1-1]
MTKITDWCTIKSEKVGKHHLTVLELESGKFDVASDTVAAVVPSHYASDERTAKLLKRLGKTKAAAHLKEKLPKSPQVRSGDLGEILGATYVQESTPFGTSINKLRWKDHRNMAMRGDDLVGIQPAAGAGNIRFLKGEVKSAANITAKVLDTARTALKKSHSRPSAHALGFIADRLHEEGNDELADLIDDALWRDGIKLSQVSHMIFAFTGNDASNLLGANVQTYTGQVAQSVVGLRVKDHQKFIRSVFGKVIKNADGK